MDAIGLNPIKLDAIGLDPVRMNAIRLGVPGASSGSGRPYIDPELLSHVKMAISTWGKSNDDPDRAVLKDLSGNGNDMRLLNFGFAGNSGYGLYSTDFTKWTKRQINDLEVSPNKISVSNKDSETTLVIWLDVNKNRYVIPSYKIKVSKLTKTITYYYIDEANPSIRSTFSINKEGTYILPISRNDLYNGEENTNIGFGIFPHESFTIEQLPDFEGWLCTDGVDDMIVSEKTVDEMIGDSKECTVISIINYISDIGSNHVNIFGERFIRNMFEKNDINGKYYICGYTSTNIDEIGNVTVVNDILGDKNDFVASYPIASGVADYFSVTGYLDTNNVPQKCAKIAYAGGFIANKALTADEINQIIAYFNLDRPGQIIKPQLYCNIKKQGITNDNHAEFNDQLIDFVGGHNIQLNNIGWKGESGIIDGALYLDGISDFGKATGLPILKDYTVAADREILGNYKGSIVSKSQTSDNGAFIHDIELSIYSFGTRNIASINEGRMVSYLSKYSYNGKIVVSGSGVDGDSMWVGTVRDNDPRFSKFALRSLMSFPYSLSEFLLERQLRKYNAGTLYPGMVEFRPVIKSNVPYSSVSYSVNPGEYIAEGSTVTITITLSNASDKLVGVSSNAISDISISGDNGTYAITGKVTKSPQRISIVISSYLTMLGNDTLISNETLIKNE